MDERAQQLLRIINEQNRKSSEGKLKIFLGMVAGVGKTFAMLSEAHILRKSGLDVVIGYIETHKRKETEELVSNLPLIPRKQITYKDKIFEEMDFEAIVVRRPHIVLIDELAHTNIPGVNHEKRYQDVLEILKLGINVHTTLNVQHIESCSSTVREITNVPIYETVPDSIIDRADEISLIDLTPEKIQTRLNEGKIYPPDKIKASLDNFFTRNNLTALREMVLRLLADKVNSDLRDSKLVWGVPQIWKTGHRLLVPIGHSDEGENIIRATRRLASNLNASWLAGNIETGKKLTAEEELHLKRNITLAKQLGAEVVVVYDEDIGSGLVRLARNHQITQIVLNKSYLYPMKKWAFLSKFWKAGFVEKILGTSDEIDVLLIGGQPREKRNWFSDHGLSSDGGWKGIIFALGGLIIVTLFNFFAFPSRDYQMAGMLYLIFLNLNSLYSGPATIIVTTFLCGLCWNFVFIPPRFTFMISAGVDWLILFAFLTVSLVSGLLTSKLRKKGKGLRANDEKLSVLYFLTRNIAETRGVEKIIRLTLDKIIELFDVHAGVLLVKDSDQKRIDQNIIGNLQLNDKEFNVASWSFNNGKTAGRFTDVLSSVEGMYIPLTGGVSCYGVLGIMTREKRTLSHNQLLILDDMAKHLALGLEREIFNENLQKTKINEAIEKVYKTLLDSVSHELKTPLSAIKGSASALLEEEILKNSTAVKSLAEQIILGSNRMQLLIQNLLDMGRIEAGKMTMRMAICDLQDILNNVIDETEYYFGKRDFNITFVPQDPPLVSVDSALFEQALKNIVQNACQYSPPDLPIDITVRHSPATGVTITIRDQGPGLPADDPSVVFQKFFRAYTSLPGGSGLGLTIAKAIIEMHGGEIIAQNAAKGGAQFIVKIPFTQTPSATATATGKGGPS